MTTQQKIDLDETQACEHCGKTGHIETFHMHEDVWICDACDKEWREHFKTCDHKWKPYVNSMGDDGQVCERCNGFVRNEDFKDMFGAEHPTEADHA